MYKFLMLSSAKVLTFLLAIVVASGSIPLTLGADLPEAAGNSQNKGAGKTLDDLFTDVSRRIPAFGGMFLDGDTLNVYLTDPRQKAAVAEAIVAVFGLEIIPVGGMQVLQGQYGFSQLKASHDRMGSLFNIDGVIFTDIDEEENRLIVGVDGGGVINAVEKELARTGIQRDMVTIVEAEPVQLVGTLRDKIRPIDGGIQIAFSQYLCTLGFNGVRSGTDGFIVNSHCTDKQGGVENTKHYQNVVTTENFIGTEIADPLYTKSKCPAGVRGKVCRWSDSAYSQRDSAVSADQGYIAKPDSVNTSSLTIAGSFRIISEGSSLVGETLNKVGRTTGWTQGNVANTCVNVGVLGSNIMQRCQDIVEAKVNSGDSGSPVFIITSGDDVQLRGILWGSTSSGTKFVYSPIGNIQRSDELGPINTCASGFSC
jgi:hypothetical protein